jgi:S1-C subfamily serine protease
VADFPLDDPGAGEPTASVAPEIPVESDVPVEPSGAGAEPPTEPDAEATQTQTVADAPLSVPSPSLPPPLLPPLLPPLVPPLLPPLTPTTAPSPTPPGERPRRRMRDVVLAGLAGGLVGALVASGVFVALDDSGDSSSSSPRTTDVIVRPSNRIARSGDIAEILKTDVPAVVAIVDDGGPESGGAAGTGFVISSDGVIVTNDHVVEGARRIQAVFSDGVSRRATVLGKNSASDLAVVKVDATDLPTIELGDSNSVQVGDDVVAIGNALALQGGLTVTRGIISGLHRELQTDSRTRLEDVIQTDAAINPGNSGGPLVDAQGRVIGINTAIANPSSAQNVGFAIPISNAKAIIDQLRQGKQPAYLGVNSQDVETAKADGHDVSARAGAYVLAVGPGTPAAKAGVEVGDVIVMMDDKEIGSAAELGNVVRQHRPGDKVELTLDRGGKKVTVNVTLGEAPSS